MTSVLHRGADFLRRHSIMTEGKNRKNKRFSLLNDHAAILQLQGVHLHNIAFKKNTKQ